MHARCSRTSRRRPMLATGFVVVAGLVLLSACGSSSSHPSGHSGATATASAPEDAGPAATGSHNAADVTFATDMIPHHAQAIEMAEMVAKKASDPAVKSLAASIAAAQDPEINTMSGWLVGWDAPVPATDSAMAHGNMPGMMSAADMAKLDAASGREFDQMWLSMMTEHHKGAVEMSRTELTRGENAQAKALATKIIDAQTAEIATMASIIKRLS